MEKLEDSLKYKIWRESLVKNDIKVTDFEELHTVRKGNGEVLFTMVKADFHTPEATKIPPVAVLRGHFVSVLVVLWDEEMKEEFVLMVKQRRVATGGYFYELPAGMCDSDSDPYTVALKEVEEETGLIINRDDLVLMRNDPVYTSPGLLDEAGYLFCIKIPMQSGEIKALDGKNTGAEHESENITLAVLSIENALKQTRNMSVIASIYTYLSLNT